MYEGGGVLVVVGADREVAGAEGLLVLEHVAHDLGRGVEADAELAQVARVAYVGLDLVGRQGALAAQRLRRRSARLHRGPQGGRFLAPGHFDDEAALDAAAYRLAYQDV